VVSMVVGGKGRMGRTSVIHRWILRFVRNQCINVSLGGKAYGYGFALSSALSSSVRSRP
jgi:hypothetical protein